MIPVAELPPEEIPPKNTVTFETVDGPSLEDMAAFHAIDAQLDEAAEEAARTGQVMFWASFPVGQHELRVLNALKKSWESGGWIVGVFQENEHYRFTFARPHEPLKDAKQVMAHRPAKDFEEVAMGSKSLAPKMGNTLLVRMPTRARAVQALEVLTKYRKFAKGPFVLEVIIDEDDESMNNSMVLQRLYDLDCIVTIGRHQNKIDACNGGRVDDWKILVLASDDMVPVMEGWDQRIIADMEKHFPLFDGALTYDDGYNTLNKREGEPVLCTLPIIGRHLYEQFGYVYYPGYGSIYCDNEYTQVLHRMNRLVFVEMMIIEHRHHAAGKAQFDVLYDFNDETYGSKDKELFIARRKRRFEAPEMVLSVLVCSTVYRQEMLRKLERHLRWQMRNFQRRVELVVDVDDPKTGGTIGEKRQRLLERAVGKYVAFVDDDDWVSHDYVHRLMNASCEGKDCASLVGVLTTNGERPERFEHSLKNKGWFTRTDGVHIRTPNHLNMVRRDLALKVGFEKMNFGEDRVFSDKLKSLLQSEASTGEAPLYYYWFRKKEAMGL